MNVDSFDTLLIIGSSKFITPYFEKLIIDDLKLIKPDHLYYEALPQNFTGKALAVVCDLDAVGDRLFDNDKIVYSVALSSTNIYNVTEGENFNEETNPNEQSKFFAAEQNYEKAFKNIPHIVLRLPELVIGTGMDNLGIKIAHQIYRGTYVHISGKDGLCSAIHASQVAEAALKCVEKDITGTYILTDGVSHSVHDLAEALAFRLNDKRIFSFTDGKARFFRSIGDILGISGWSSKMYDFKTKKLTFSPERLLSSIDFRPVSVTEYLKNHNYDENSL